MKHSILSLIAATTLASALSMPPAFAGGGHDHGPRYGGVVREVQGVSYELLARPDALTLYVSDHGKPIATQGAEAEATIYAGNDKTTVRLQPAGENRMAAKGDFRVGVGVRVTVSTSLPGKAAAKATFNLK